MPQPRELPACVNEPARLEKDRREPTPDLKLSADPHAWALTITSSGGFFGWGAGDLGANSEGAVHRSGPTAKTGSTRAPADALQPLAIAVNRAQPGVWRACYVQPRNPHGCCDMFRYTLTLRRRNADRKDETYELYWYSDSGELLPADVRAIVDGTRQLADERLGAKKTPVQ